jgi:site-specific recombinase XerD
VALRAAGRTPQTIETRTEHIRRMARQTGAPTPSLLPRSRLVEWAGSKDWARETRRSTYASIRSFYRWALEDGRVTEDVADMLPSVKPGPAVPRPTPEHVYTDALADADARTRIILRCAAEEGLRRAEIAQISRDDLIEDLDGWTLLVHGKGQKDRLVPLTDSLAADLRTYLGQRRWLLPSPTGHHLTPRHVGKIASRALPGVWALHSLRHRFASTLHAEGVDLLVIRDLLGHESVATTQRYTAVGSGEARAAVRRARPA